MKRGPPGPSENMDAKGRRRGKKPPEGIKWRPPEGQPSEPTRRPESVKRGPPGPSENTDAKGRRRGKKPPEGIKWRPPEGQPFRADPKARVRETRAPRPE